MSLTSVNDVRGLVPAPSVDDVNLQLVIDREEAWLARELGAPLAGDRTQTVWRLDRFAPFGSATLAGWDGITGPIFLMRPTDDIAVTDNGIELDPADIRLIASGWAVEKSSRWTGPQIDLAYTPNDADEIVRVVIELCRLTIVETGFNSENTTDYSYQRTGVKPATAMQVQASSRRVLVRSLLPRPRQGSISLSSAARATELLPA